MRHFILSDDVARCVESHIARLKQDKNKTEDKDVINNINKQIKTLSDELDDYNSRKGKKLYG